MQKARLVTGRLTGPKSIELDEAVTEMNTEVEVLLRPTTRISPIENASDYLRNLPPGIRTKEDIDQQIKAEHDSWGDR